MSQRLSCVCAPRLCSACSHCCSLSPCLTSSLCLFPAGPCLPPPAGLFCSPPTSTACWPTCPACASLCSAASQRASALARTSGEWVGGYGQFHNVGSPSRTPQACLLSSQVRPPAAPDACPLPPHSACSAGTSAAWDAQSVAALMQLARSLPDLSVHLERSEPPGMQPAAAPSGAPS